MNYEEKRELRIQISQILADAGLNQATIREMIEEEIKHKVDRALNQALIRLNSECHSGDYIQERLIKQISNTYVTQNKIENAVKEEIKNKIIHVTLKDIEVNNE